MNWRITSQSPYITWTDGSVPCGGKSVVAQVEVRSDAPPVSIPITVTSLYPYFSGVCSAAATIEVVNLVDVAFAGVSEADEGDPSGFLCVNDDDDNNNGTADFCQDGICTHPPFAH